VDDAADVAAPRAEQLAPLALQLDAIEMRQVDGLVAAGQHLVSQLGVTRCNHIVATILHVPRESVLADDVLGKLIELVADWFVAHVDVVESELPCNLRFALARTCAYDPAGVTQLGKLAEQPVQGFRGHPEFGGPAIRRQMYDDVCFHCLCL